MKLTKEMLIDWIDRPPSNTDFKIITYIINLQNNRDKAIEFLKTEHMTYDSAWQWRQALINILKGDSE